MNIQIETMAGFSLSDEDRETLYGAAVAAVKDGRDINDAFNAIDTSDWHDSNALFENVSIYDADAEEAA